MAESLLTNFDDSPASIPSGTVTFLFTDIQGSTQLLERLREQYALVLAEQRDVMRAIFAEWNGHEIDTQGDAFFVAFPRALDAVNCAIQAQRALAAHTWPQNVRVYVRMGLHTGEPIIARTGYIGMDVHLAARIGAAGHGGQILLSKTTRELVYADLPHGVSLRDLGEHKLKDIRHPQKIYQVEIEGLNVEFPSLKTLATGEEPPTPGNPPFKGMQFFDEADADLFFGREAMTAQLIERIQDQRFLAIIGASGSGKSSVVRAGLVPQLKRQQAAHWHIHVLMPTSHPLEALAASLTHSTESVTATTTLIDDLAHDKRSLHLYVRKSDPAARLLIVVDQFEELFTLCRNEAERQAFVDNLLYAQSADGTNATIVIVLRADFYEHLAQYAVLREAVAKHQEYLGPMSAEELREAIEEPAKRGGWEFSPGLVDLMLHDVGATADNQPEPGALPLLSHALLETWRRRRGNVMTLKGYSESGGVRGAIAHTAETVYYTELNAEQRLIARSIFLRLTELGEGTQDTRRRASLEELFPPASFATPAQVEEVVVKLADARLITTGEGTVEVAHEALIREWSTLREWLTQNREGLRLHRHLTEAAQEWELLERDASVLYRGTRLAQAVEWAEANPRELNAQEQAFLDTSKEFAVHEEAEREAQRRRELEAAQKLVETEQRRAEEQTQSASRLRRRAIYLSGALIIAALLAIVALIFGQQSNNNAQQAQVNLQNAETAEARAVNESQVRATAEGNALAQQATAVAESQIRATQQSIAEANFRRAEAERLAGAANNLLLTGGNVQQIALLSLRSMNLQYSTQGDLALAAASRLVYPDQIFLGHTKDVVKVAFTPDGRQLLTGSSDGSARLWDIQTGQEVLRLGTQYTSVTGIAISVDGNFALVSGGNKEAVLWDLKTGERLRTFTHPVAVYDVAFTPDGQSVATIDAQQHVYLWNIKTGEIIWQITTPEDISNMTMAPNGKYLATSGEFSPPRLWDVKTGQEIKSFASNFSSAISIAFSPDSQYLLIGTWDSITAEMLDVQTGQSVRSFKGHSNLVRWAVFSPDGRYVATGSDDKTARLWDAQSAQLLQTFSGHTDMIYNVAFSPDGKYVASGSKDGTALIWEVNPTYETPRFTGFSGAVNAVAYSPDGRYLLTGGDDYMVRLWDAHTAQQVRTFTGHQDPVVNTAFSPDGQFALSGSVDKTIRIWNVATGQEVQRFALGEDVPVNEVFSPNGKYVFAGYATRRDAVLWSIETGKVITTFTGLNRVVNSVAISPDGKYALAGGNVGALILWTFPEPTIVRRYQGHTDLIMCAFFSPNGKFILTTSFDKTARLWDTQSGQELKRFTGQATGLTACAFSPDGNYVAAGDTDGTLRIWDAITGEEVRRFDLHLFVTDVKFSPDGKQLAITSNNKGEFNVWDVDYHDTMRYLCSRFQRDLTDGERKQFGITDTSPTCPAKVTP